MTKSNAVFKERGLFFAVLGKLLRLIIVPITLIFFWSYACSWWCICPWIKIDFLPDSFSFDKIRFVAQATEPKFVIAMVHRIVYMKFRHTVSLIMLRFQLILRHVRTVWTFQNWCSGPLRTNLCKSTDDMIALVLLCTGTVTFWLVALSENHHIVCAATEWYLSTPTIRNTIQEVCIFTSQKVWSSVLYSNWNSNTCHCVLFSFEVKSAVRILVFIENNMDHIQKKTCI